MGAGYPRTPISQLQAAWFTWRYLTPLFKGGSHTFSNIVPACGRCNSSKGTNPPPVPVQPLLLTLAPSRVAS